MNVLQAIADAKVFAPWFQRGDWTAWHAFLAALFGLPMTADQLALYQTCTGRITPPAEPFQDSALVCGRRSGKSFTLALIAVFAACFRDWRPYLQRGERATIVIVAADKKQARSIFRYIVALIEGVPMLAGLIERQTNEAIDLHRSVSIEVMTANFRTLRSYAVPVALLDELAFWPNEDSANPDSAVIEALQPAMAQFPGAMMLMASSPYARRGELWRAFKENHGRDDAPVLVWQAATRTMNPSIPQSYIDRAYARDSISAASEYGASWRTDVEQLLTQEALAACIDTGVFERPWQPGERYWAFFDGAGGSGTDSAALAIATCRGDKAVIVALREIRPPFSPDAMISEFSALLREYGLRTVTGDRWAGEFPREGFRRLGCDYHVAKLPKSDLYRELVAIVNSGRLVMLDHKRAVAQLLSLERRTGRGGRDSIDAPHGQPEDAANAVAGCVELVLKHRISTDPGIAGPMVFTYDTDFSSLGEFYG
jgi:hypothetical protein